MGAGSVEQHSSGDGNIVVGHVGGSLSITVDTHRDRLLPLDSPRSDDHLAGLPELPSLQVHPLYTRVPFVGRSDLLVELVNWCQSGPDIAVRIISGPGGTGKTRLALEVCRQLIDSGWAAGFLKPVHDLEQLETLAATRAPRLVVVDYAETRATQLEEVVQQLCAVPSASPIRFLLLDRQQVLTAGAESGLGRLTRQLMHGAPDPISLAAEPLPAARRAELYQVALATFGGALTAREDSPALLEEVPLLVTVAAFLDAANSGSAISVGMNRQDLLDEVLIHEQKHWHAPPSDVDEALARRVIAATTLCPTESEDDAAEMLRSVLPEVGDQCNPYQVARWAQRNYRTRDQARWVSPVEPDLIGEHLVAEHLPSSCWPAALDRPAWAIGHTLRVLSRLRADHPRHEDVYTGLVGSRLEDLFDTAVHQVAQFADHEIFGTPALASALVQVLGDLPLDDAQLGCAP